MAVRAAFQPVYTKGQTVTAGAASANMQIGKGSKSIVVTNLDTANVIYVRVGAGSTLAAAATDYIILPRSKETLSKQQDDDYLAYISPAGGDLNAIPGEGY